jgi:uncharacterized protein (TIGR02147 family)
MNEVIDIFNYNNHLQYLNAVTKHFLSQKFRPTTLGEWAMRLGQSSPRSFGMVLKGQRLPSEKMIDSLSKYLKLSRKESEYLKLLVKLDRYQQKNLPVKDILTQLKMLNDGKKDFLSLNTTQFSFIAEWYHLPINQLIKSRQVKGITIQEIHSLLRKKVTHAQLREALENLQTIGIVFKKNELYFSKTSDLSTGNTTPSEAIRCHHQGMIDQAKIALNERPMEERDFQSLCLNFSPEDMMDAKKEILEFKNRFNQMFSKEKNTVVYQMNIQLFSHTNKDEYEN